MLYIEDDEKDDEKDDEELSIKERIKEIYEDIEQTEKCIDELESSLDHKKHNISGSTLYKQYINLLKCKKIHIKTYRPNSMTGTQAHRFVSQRQAIIDLFKSDEKYNCTEMIDDNATDDGIYDSDIDHSDTDEIEEKENIYLTWCADYTKMVDEFEKMMTHFYEVEKMLFGIVDKRIEDHEITTWRESYDEYNKSFIVELNPICTHKTQI